MLIRITIHDPFLCNCCKINKGAIYKVIQTTRYGYRVYGRVNYPCNLPLGSKELTLIKFDECKVIKQ